MAVSRNEMEHAASMVRAIADGKWADDAPDWANGEYPEADNGLRAVQTAEAFIIFFQAFNPRFDVTRFLVACGLVDAPAKRRVK